MPPLLAKYDGRILQESYSIVTTIVTDGKVLVGDCQLTSGGVSLNYQDKIRKINGHLVGGCGSPDDLALFMAWYANPGKPPKLGKNFEAVVVNEAGSIFYYSNRLIPQQIHEPFYATGSGSYIALGALEHGATPLEALKIACKRDIHTGVGIAEIKLDEQRRKLPKKSGVRAGGGVRKKPGRKS